MFEVELGLLANGSIRIQCALDPRAQNLSVHDGGRGSGDVYGRGLGRGCWCVGAAKGAGMMRAAGGVWARSGCGGR